MEQAEKTLMPRAPDARQVMGWIIVAVILGEAIWNLIVSVMNNLVVPWLGDVMGPSSGLPASFIQRPYDYPAFFVSLLESCIAGLTAAILNYFFQPRRVARANPARSAVPIAAVEPIRIIPQAAAAEAMTPIAAPVVSPVVPPFVAPVPPVVAAVASPAPIEKPAPPAMAAKVAAAAPALVEVPAVKPVESAPAALPAAREAAPQPIPAAPKAVPPKPKKAKPVYYNIVGEPMPSDED